MATKIHTTVPALSCHWGKPTETGDRHDDTHVQKQTNPSTGEGEKLQGCKMVLLLWKQPGGFLQA